MPGEIESKVEAAIMLLENIRAKQESNAAELKILLDRVVVLENERDKQGSNS